MVTRFAGIFHHINLTTPSATCHSISHFPTNVVAKYIHVRTHAYVYIHPPSTLTLIKSLLSRTRHWRICRRVKTHQRTMISSAFSRVKQWEEKSRNERTNETKNERKSKRTKFWRDIVTSSLRKSRCTWPDICLDSRPILATLSPVVCPLCKRTRTPRVDPGYRWLTLDPSGTAETTGTWCSSRGPLDRSSFRPPFREDVRERGRERNTQRARGTTRAKGRRTKKAGSRGREGREGSQRQRKGGQITPLSRRVLRSESSLRGRGRCREYRAAGGSILEGLYSCTPELGVHERERRRFNADVSLRRGSFLLGRLWLTESSSLIGSEYRLSVDVIIRQTIIDYRYQGSRCCVTLYTYANNFMHFSWCSMSVTHVEILRLLIIR